jgi:hypothetical protein
MVFGFTYRESHANGIAGIASNGVTKMKPLASPLHPNLMPEGKRVSFPTPSQACGMSTGRSLGRSGIWLHGQTVVEVSLPYIHMILSLAFHELHTDRVDAGGFDGGC